MGRCRKAPDGKHAPAFIRQEPYKKDGRTGIKKIYKCIRCNGTYSEITYDDGKP